MSPPARTALVTGATGFNGGRLRDRAGRAGLACPCPGPRSGARGRPGRCRDRAVRGGRLDADSLRGAGEGAYYLVHAMGRGGEGAVTMWSFSTEVARRDSTLNRWRYARSFEALEISSLCASWCALQSTGSAHDKGEMSPVSKTVRRLRVPRGFESHLVR